MHASYVYDLSIIIDTNTGSDGLISTQVLHINTWNVKTESPKSIGFGTAQPLSKLLIPLYVLGSIIVIVLCVLLGFAVVCKIKITNRQADNTNVDLQRETSNSNREYCEIADTIYESISDNLADLGMQVKTANNDAYTENIQFHFSTGPGINVRNNDAYYVTNAVTVPMKQSSSESSYRAAADHLQHFPKLSVAIDSYHSDGSKKKDNNLDGTDLRLENLCTSTTECLQATVLNKGDSCTDHDHIFDS